MLKFASIFIMLFMSISSLYAQQTTHTQNSDGSFSTTFSYDNGSSNTMNSDGSWSTSNTVGNTTYTYESDGSYSTTTEY